MAMVIRDSTGSPQRVVGTNWDITEVRTLAEQLRHVLDDREERLDQPVELLPSMLCDPLVADEPAQQLCRAGGIAVESGGDSVQPDIHEIGAGGFSFERAL